MRKIFGVTLVMLVQAPADLTYAAHKNILLSWIRDDPPSLAQTCHGAFPLEYGFYYSLY